MSGGCEGGGHLEQAWYSAVRLSASVAVSTASVAGPSHERMPTMGYWLIRAHAAASGHVHDDEVRTQRHPPAARRVASDRRGEDHSGDRRGTRSLRIHREELR